MNFENIERLRRFYIKKIGQINFSKKKYFLGQIIDRKTFYLSQQKLAQKVAFPILLNIFEASVTWLGDFGNFLATYFITKVAQVFIDLLGYFGKFHFCVKTAVSTLSQLLEKLGFSSFQHLVTLLTSSYWLRRLGSCES